MDKRKGAETLKEKQLREVLKAERKRQNKSRLQVARRAGVCENTVLAFENHPKYNSTFRTAEGIARALGYKIVWTLERLDK